jgi:hypothetical protein
MAFKITIYFGMDQNLIVVYSKVNGNFKSHVNFKIIIKKKTKKWLIALLIQTHL